MEVERTMVRKDGISRTQGYINSNLSIRNSISTSTEEQDVGLGDLGASLNHDITSTNGSRQDRIEKAIAHLNKIAQDSAINVHLEYNQDADRVVIKFVDGQNNKVVKQIPSDSVLDMDIQVRKFIGLLFDKMG